MSSVGLTATANSRGVLVLYGVRGIKGVSHTTAENRQVTQVALTYAACRCALAMAAATRAAFGSLIDRLDQAQVRRHA